MQYSRIGKFFWHIQTFTFHKEGRAPPPPPTPRESPSTPVSPPPFLRRSPVRTPFRVLTQPGSSCLKHQWWQWLHLDGSEWASKPMPIPMRFTDLTVDVGRGSRHHHHHHHPSLDLLQPCRLQGLLNLVLLLENKFGPPIREKSSRVQGDIPCKGSGLGASHDGHPGPNWSQDV